MVSRTWKITKNGSGIPVEELEEVVQIAEITPELLSQIVCPTLVVLGEHDFAGPATPLVSALPNSSFVELKGVDHFATPKDFGFIDAALTFLDAQPF